MNTSLNHAVLPFLLTVATATSAYAQGDARLHGSWTCVEGLEKGEQVTLTAESATIRGQKVRMTVPERGVIVLQGTQGATERMYYGFRGEDLVIGSGEERTVWSKRAPKPDPRGRVLSRVFRGEGIELLVEVQ